MIIVFEEFIFYFLFLRFYFYLREHEQGGGRGRERGRSRLSTEHLGARYGTLSQDPKIVT